jgi:hypothetical protein
MEVQSQYTDHLGNMIMLLEHAATIQPDEELEGLPALSIEAIVGYKLVSHPAGEVRIGVGLPGGRSVSNTETRVPIREGSGTVRLNLWVDVDDTRSSLSSDRACLEIGLGYWQTAGPEPGFHYAVHQHLDDVCYSLEA